MSYGTACLTLSTPGQKEGQVFAHLFPLTIENTITRRIPMGFVVTNHVVANNTFKLPSNFFDGSSGTLISHIRFQLHANGS